jgi:hypothetical protein
VATPTLSKLHRTNLFDYFSLKVDELSNWKTDRLDPILRKLRNKYETLKSKHFESKKKLKTLVASNKGRIKRRRKKKSRRRKRKSRVFRFVALDMPLNILSQSYNHLCSVVSINLV